MQTHTPPNDIGDAFSDGSCSRQLPSDCLVDLFQAVHLTQEWMEKKLPTYLKRDTECLSHNTWMINCKLLLSLFPSLQQEIFYKLFHINWCLMFARWNNIVFHIKNSRYQIMMRCWQNDPDERPAFTELKNQLKDKETLHKVRIMVDMAICFYAWSSLNKWLVIQIAE